MVRLIFALILFAWPAAAQPRFPERPVTIIVPFAAGGPTDVVARQLAEVMTRDLGISVVVEAVTGGGGTIGAHRVVLARPDGHTLLLGNVGVATAPALYRRLPYDPLRDFETIGLVTPVPILIVARPDHPARDIGGLAAWIRERGAGVNFAHAGIGSASHLCGILLRSALGVEMTPIAFRGTAPITTELMAGRVDLTCDQATNIVPYVQDNRVRAYATTAPERLAVLPGLPTVAEGGLSDLQFAAWHGLYAPRGTPLAVRERLAASLRIALADEVVRRRFAELATAPEPPERVTPAAHRALLEAEIARWRPVVERAGDFAD